MINFLGLQYLCLPKRNMIAGLCIFAVLFGSEIKAAAVPLDKRAATQAKIAKESADKVLKAEWAISSKLLNYDLKANPDKNQIFAPHSLSMMMRMARKGAGGKTSQEIDLLFPELIENHDIIQSIPEPKKEQKTRFELGMATSTNAGYGLIVKKVIKNGPASRAELHVNDLILAIDSVPTRTTQDLQTILDLKKPGVDPSFRLKFYRYSTGQVEERLLKPDIVTEAATLIPPLIEKRVLLYQRNMKLSPEFEMVTGKKFLVNSIPVDFKQLEDSTIDSVAKLLSVDPLKPMENLRAILSPQPLSRLMMISSLSFQSNWLDRFQDRPGAFYNSKKEFSQPPTFGNITTLQYASTQRFHVAEIHYSDAGASFILILPKENGPIPQISETESDEIFKAMTQMQPKKVDITMPAFQYGTEIIHNGALQSNGLSTPFSNQADFSGITKDQDLKIDQINQVCEIELDRIGTKASALTKFSMVAKSGIDPPAENIIVKADHPFLYLIVQRDTGTILFAGHVENP